MTDARPYGLILGRNVSAARGRLQLSQGAVAARMRALGFQWQQQTVAAVEKAKRRPTAEEIFGLAWALGTTIPALTGASGQDEAIRLPGGQTIGAVSVERLAGRGVNDRAITWHGIDVPVVVGMRYLPGVDPFDKELLAQPGFTDAPPQPVVAVVVTSDRGVLVGRRKDRTPPWTFIAGEQEPGEQPEDTAIREVKEETGLRIQVGNVIGERDHPATGRHMIYMAAAPTHGTDVFVGDEAELAEVRWIDLGLADELLPGMFGPVRDHLERELGEVQR